MSALIASTAMNDFTSAVLDSPVLGSASSPSFEDKLAFDPVNLQPTFDNHSRKMSYGGESASSSRTETTCRRQTNSTIATSPCPESAMTDMDTREESSQQNDAITPPSPTPDLSYLELDYAPAPPRPTTSTTNGHTDTFPYPSPDSASFSTRPTSQFSQALDGGHTSRSGPTSDDGSMYGSSINGTPMTSATPASDIESDVAIEDGFERIAFGTGLPNHRSTFMSPENQPPIEGFPANMMDREMTQVVQNFENVSLERSQSRSSTTSSPSTSHNRTRSLQASSSTSQPRRSSTTSPFNATKTKFQFPNFGFALGSTRTREDHLSFTRPRALPPKSAKEEKKHLKQYESMVKTYQKAQRQESSRQRKLNSEDSKRRTKELRQWEEYVLPNFHKRNVNRRVQAIWWHGIPPRLRGEIWRTVMMEYGAGYGDLYHTSLKRADMLWKKASEGRFKVDGVMPELNLFQEHSPCYQDLVAVASAYLTAKSSDSTLLEQKPGILWLMATFCINLPPEDAFKASMFVSGQKVWHGIVEGGRDGERMAKVFGCRVRDTIGEVFFELALQGVEIGELLGIWFSSMFSAHLPLDLAHRFMDIYYLHGESLLFHIAHALLTLRKPEIIAAGSKEGLLRLLSSTQVVKEGEERRVLELVGMGIREGWSVT